MLTAHLKPSSLFLFFSFHFISEIHYHPKSVGGPRIFGPEKASPSTNYPCVEPSATVHFCFPIRLLVRKATAPLCCLLFKKSKE